MYISYDDKKYGNTKDINITFICIQTVFEKGNEAKDIRVQK